MEWVSSKVNSTWCHTIKLNTLKFLTCTLNQRWEHNSFVRVIGGIVGCVCLCLYAENGATLLVGIWQLENKNKLDKWKAPVDTTGIKKANLKEIFVLEFWGFLNAGNVIFETLYGGQFMPSTQLIILNYPIILSHWLSTTVSLETYPLSSWRSLVVGYPHPKVVYQLDWLIDGIY